MKGVVFVELLEMADKAVGEEAVDRVIARCPLSSGGAYTAVGTYPAEELGHLVTAFSEAAGAPPEALQRSFGHWMLTRFAETYPAFFQAQPDAFTMLESVEGEVHTEVRKLYPDAELPKFETERLACGALRMTYISPRRLADFCHGLIEACLAHYGEKADIQRTDRSSGVLGIVDFVIRRTAA